MKTWIEAHEGEIWGENPECDQCKDCAYRTVILYEGEQLERYQNTSCLLLETKPVEVMLGEQECEFYEKTEAQ